LTDSAKDEGLAVVATSRLRLEDVLYLEPEKLLTSVPLTTRIARGLDALLKLSTSIQAEHDSESLNRKILQCLFDITPAERASLVLLEDSGEPQSAIAFNRKMEEESTALIHSVVEQVLKEGSGVLSNDVEQHSTETTPKITSLIGVPMEWMGSTKGILYMDTGDSGARFDEDHLQLASAIATIGAVSFEGIKSFNRLQQDHLRLIEELRIVHNMVGDSEAMKVVYSLISRIAGADSTTLIQGESGTGKELAARAIHLNSSRSGKALIAINCANLSESLLESELFGYEKGAFTGAHALKKGKIEMAAAERFSWMKSASSPSRCNRVCCASCRNVNLSGSVEHARFKLISA
jgi:transcriptional regulator with GAF, ATPase, and Fis domain